MFFGNQLTYEWWSYWWLSEGFCTFYHSYMAQRIFPEMRFEETFAVETLNAALRTDSSPHTKPMTFYVEKRKEIESIHNLVVYYKCEFYAQQLKFY
jgi:aminopeptidase N